MHVCFLFTLPFIGASLPTNFLIYIILNFTHLEEALSLVSGFSQLLFLIFFNLQSISDIYGNEACVVVVGNGISPEEEQYPEKINCSHRGCSALVQNAEECQGFPLQCTGEDAMCSATSALQQSNEIACGG